ncbi:hypothetical protein P4O66_003916 [Electrophorus voltai]|uniref:Uncharacterized protein n=1 Tax=Electrophorus voltai TaxID=2609070 RepID=A0AAD8ZST7_9TELE|nr:hypothetical protein P4O66_003916 [Electrophorus voltai]
MTSFRGCVPGTRAPPMQMPSMMADREQVPGAQFASCCGSCTLQPWLLFGRGPGGGYMLLTCHGPRGAPRPSLACRTPQMTLRQICHMLRIMRQVRRREAATAADNARKQVAVSAMPSSPSSQSERRCLLSCLRRRHTSNVKKVKKQALHSEGQHKRYVELLHFVQGLRTLLRCDEKVISTASLHGQCAGVASAHVTPHLYSNTSPERPNVLLELEV